VGHATGRGIDRACARCLDPLLDGRSASRAWGRPSSPARVRTANTSTRRPAREPTWRGRHRPHLPRGSSTSLSRSVVIYRIMIMDIYRTRPSQHRGLTSRCEPDIAAPEQGDGPSFEELESLGPSESVRRCADKRMPRRGGPSRIAIEARPRPMRGRPTKSPPTGRAPKAISR
jgi:hypothetical protein